MEVILVCVIVIVIIIVVKRVMRARKWRRIEALNNGLGITRKTAYLDKNGYLRWRENDRLCHRDIAWKHGIRGPGKFGNCDVHHMDGNKLNNNPYNLEVLTREEHQQTHGQVIFRYGKKYYKLARIHKIYRETLRAIMVAGTWIPKSQVIYENGYVYVSEWIWFQKGFGV